MAESFLRNGVSDQKKQPQRANENRSRPTASAELGITNGVPPAILPAQRKPRRIAKVQSFHVMYFAIAGSRLAQDPRYYFFFLINER